MTVKIGDRVVYDEVQLGLTWGDPVIIEGVVDAIFDDGTVSIIWDDGLVTSEVIDTAGVYKL